MSNLERAFLKAISFVFLPIFLISSTLFTGGTNGDALSNPLAGKPLGFDEMLPYLSEQQPIYRSGTGDNRDNPLGTVIEPSDDNEELPAPNETKSYGSPIG